MKCDRTILSSRMFSSSERKYAVLKDTKLWTFPTGFSVFRRIFLSIVEG